MKKQNEYTFKHLVNSCIVVTIKAYSEIEARQMFANYVKNSQDYFIV
jgi:hypothetical protein